MSVHSNRVKHIGVLGAGQLGRMLALAGYPLGNTFTFLDTTGNPSAGIGEVVVDPDNQHLAAFLDKVDVVTYEFEHLPVALVQQIEQHKPVYPSSRAIAVCQNRVEEKALFDRLGIPTPAYRVVESAEQIEKRRRELAQQEKQLKAAIRSVRRPSSRQLGHPAPTGKPAARNARWSSAKSNPNSVRRRPNSASVRPVSMVTAPQEASRTAGSGRLMRSG